MNIMPARPGDSAELIALKRRCPQGRGLVTSLVNRPDFFARALAWPRHEVFTVSRRGKILGSASLGLAEALVGEKPQTVGYQFEYFVDPEQRRQGVARDLLQHMESYLASAKAHLSYLIVQEGNRPSLNFFTKAGYRLRPDLKMEVLYTHREVPPPEGGRARRAAKDELPDLARLANRSLGNCQLYQPATGYSLARFLTTTPGHSPKRMLVWERDGAPAACLGIWDLAAITELTVVSVSGAMRLAGLAARALSRFVSLPPLPRPGQVIRQWCVTSLGYADPESLAAILKVVNNLAHASGVDAVLFLLDPAQVPDKVFKGLSRRPIKMHLLAKPLQDGAALAAGPVHLDGMHL